MTLHVAPTISITSFSNIFRNRQSKFFLDLMNDIWETGDLPSIWKLANVIPIPKPGKDQGRIQDFKLGGAHLKFFFWGISCENSRFYPKKADYRISRLPLTSNSKNKTVVSKLHCMSNL